MSQAHKIVVEFDVVAPTEEMARGKLETELRGISLNARVRIARRGHEIVVREEPTREQLADWTEPW